MPATSGMTAGKLLQVARRGRRGRVNGMPVAIDASARFGRAATRSRRSLRKAPPPRSAVKSSSAIGL